MLITSQDLENLRVGFHAHFQEGLEKTPVLRNRVATTIPSSAGENRYGWLHGVPMMREWVGARVIENAQEASYSIANRSFETTQSVLRDHVADKNLGQYSALFHALGESAVLHAESLVWGTLAAGWTDLCWDGQPFFSNAHPITNRDGSAGTFSNDGGGSGTRWYLAATQRSIKPLIFQERQAAEFVALDKVDSEHVFLLNRFTYGVSMRCAAGYTLPQLCYGSRQPLNAASYEAARAAILGMRSEGGAPMGLIPDLLIVPPSLDAQGRRVVEAALDENGATNIWAKSAELLVVPYLT